MKNIIVAVAVSSLFSAPAFAEPFQGAFAGVEVGMDNFEVSGEDIFVAGDEFDGLSGNGVQGGVFVGYDMPLGDKLFFGIEASANLSDASMTYDDGFDRLTISAKESFGLSGRLGAMVNDSTGLYGRVGFVTTEFSASVDNVSESDRDDGMVLGAGIETRVGNGSIRAEYNRADYADELKNNQFSLGYAYRF